ncbi:MAG: hypothetical protein KAQ68_02540 [Clostridiales bacterium]|nr:hypothetical protein [Clostridiales bacterium]
MFFDPLWFYLKGLIVTLIVEVGLFAFIISKKPLRILAASSFNITSHILLHLFFHFMVVWGFGYNFYAWLIGEILVLLLEGFLYWFSKLIPDIKKAYLWAFVFNIASIILGQIINLIFL